MPIAVGVGTGLLCAVHGYSALETLALVTLFYLVWRLTAWTPNP